MYIFKFSYCPVVTPDIFRIRVKLICCSISISPPTLGRGYTFQLFLVESNNVDPKPNICFLKNRKEVAKKSKEIQIFIFFYLSLMPFFYFSNWAYFEFFLTFFILSCNYLAVVSSVVNNFAFNSPFLFCNSFLKTNWLTKANILIF